MKTRSNGSKIPVVLAAGLVSACSAAAQDMGSGPSGAAGSYYVNGAAGLAIMQDMTAQGEQIGYDVGPRIDVSAGYNVTENIAVELQSGFAYNGISTLGGQSLSGTPVSGDIWTWPVMANGIYKYSFNNQWQAYGGIGAGVVISTFDLSGLGSNVSPTDTEFGYQAMFGVKYLINDHWSCGLGYNFLGTLDHHWDANGSGLTTTPTYLHSILLSLTYKF